MVTPFVLMRLILLLLGGLRSKYPANKKIAAELLPLRLCEVDFVCEGSGYKVFKFSP